MSESPDFEQIALSLAKKTSYYDDAEEVPGFTAGVLVAIEEQLRQVWNARGAADAEAVEAALDFKGDVYADLHLTAQHDAIRKLDR